MAKTNMTITVNQELKKEAQQILSEMGLSLSGAIELFLTKVVKERAIPFPITADRTKEGYVYAIVSLKEAEHAEGADEDD